MKDWIFYVLHGQAVRHPRPNGFWKVGTMPAASVDARSFEPSLTWLTGRRNYGSHVDPDAEGRNGRVYTKPRIASPERSQRSTRVGYHPPKLGTCTVPDPIGWRPVYCGIDVDLKEIDQLIAAFAEDEGWLIRNRGQVRRGIKGGYTGAIEIIDGGLDLYDLIFRIGSSPSSAGRRLSEAQRSDLDALTKGLAQGTWKLRPGAPTAA